MIKAFLNIIVSVNLLVAFTGFTLSTHYCGDDLVSVAVNHQAASCCKSDCGKCHTEDHYVKLKEDLSSPVHFEKLQISQVDLMLSPIVIFNQTFTENSNNYAFISKSPPGRSGPEMLSSFQSFLL